MYRGGGLGGCWADGEGELFLEEEFGWRFLGRVGVLGGSPRRAISCWLGDFGCKGSCTEVDNGLFFGSCDVFG